MWICYLNYSKIVVKSIFVQFIVSLMENRVVVVVPAHIHSFKSVQTFSARSILGSLPTLAQVLCTISMSIELIYAIFHIVGLIKHRGGCIICMDYRDYVSCLSKHTHRTCTLSRVKLFKWNVGHLHFVCTKLKQLKIPTFAWITCNEIYCKML